METKFQSISLEVKNGTPVVSSRTVATVFEKRHDHVLRDIENIIRESQTSIEESEKEIFNPAGNLTAQNWGVNFFLKSSYLSDRGKTYPEYLMTRDGFSLLAMGFTGKKALQFKVAFINRFNEMERQLKSGKPAETKTDLDALEYAGGFASVLTSQFGIDSGIARSFALVRSEQNFGVNFEDVKKLLPPAQTKSRLLNATQIGREFGGMKARDVNLWLEYLGLQIQIGNEWISTDAGMRFSQYVPITAKHGKHSGRQLRWEEREIIDYLRENPLPEDINR